MNALPAGLLARFDEDQATTLSRLVAGMTEVYAEQYRRERRSFDVAEGDDGITFAWNLRQHGWARVNEITDGLPDVQVKTRGVVQSVCFEDLTIRPYKLGNQAPEDIHLERFDPKSQIRAFTALDNSAKAQLALDIKGAINAPEPDPARKFAPNQLVLGHYGNPRTGREAIILGAPLNELRDGSYWQWVIQLADAQDDEDGCGYGNGTEPTPPTPYSEADEPNIPLAPREQDDKLPGQP